MWDSYYRAIACSNDESAIQNLLTQVLGASTDTLTQQLEYVEDVDDFEDVENNFKFERTPLHPAETWYE